MILFVETKEEIQAYLVDPLFCRNELIGSCDKFNDEQILLDWKNKVENSPFAQLSDCLELIEALKLNPKVTLEKL